MSKIFTQTQNTHLKSNVFTLPHSRKLSLKFGQLVPILVMPTVPGDEISLDVSQMLRFQPILAPVMHRISVYTHYYWVPYRQLWKHWDKFMTEPMPDDVLDPEIPEIPRFNIGPADSPVNLLEVSAGDLGDHLGLPITNPAEAPHMASGLEIPVSILPFLAYQKIIKDFYRDQNLEPPSPDDTDPDYYYNQSLWPLEEYGHAGGHVTLSGLISEGGEQTEAFMEFMTTLRYRARHHDYFTSALPFAQKADPVLIPLGTTAPIDYVSGGQPANLRYNTDGTTYNGHGIGDVGFNNLGQVIGDPGGMQDLLDIDNSENLQVNLTQATAASITDLRTAFQLEKYYETDARSGSRYFESIKAHFGVHIPDGNLLRPRYLGGGSNPVVISEVLQTSSATSEPTPQGNMSGHAISAGKSAGFKTRVNDHGLIIGIMSVMPKNSYQQGIPREFTKFDKFDYFTSEFQNIGEQPIYNKEIFAQALPVDDEVFGYIPRYSEYKYIPDTVHGVFKTTYDFWHGGLIMSSLPGLNKDFIKMNPDQISRIFSVVDPDAEQLLCFVNHNIKARRKMQYFGTPGIKIM